jgi:hypothetical protein
LSDDPALIAALFIWDRGGILTRKVALIAAGLLTRDGEITARGGLALLDCYRDECRVLRRALTDLRGPGDRDDLETRAAREWAMRKAFPNTHAL